MTQSDQLLTRDQLIEFGKQVGRGLPAASVVHLSGDLGTGKTTLVQAICAGLDADRFATSPTFALVHRYETPRAPVYHVDCYRLKHLDEARDLDFSTMLGERAIILIEWPERAEGWVPESTHRFVLSYADDSVQRRLTTA